VSRVCIYYSKVRCRQSYSTEAVFISGSHIVVGFSLSAYIFIDSCRVLEPATEKVQVAFALVAVAISYHH